MLKQTFHDIARVLIIIFLVCITTKKFVKLEFYFPFLVFQDNIGLLYPILEKVKRSKAGIAMAPEQTKAYMQAFAAWQKMNPSTKIGMLYSTYYSPIKFHKKSFFNLLIFNFTKFSFL